MMPARCDPGASHENGSVESAHDHIKRALTHRTVVRLGPPLVISREDLDWAWDRLDEVVAEMEEPQSPQKAEWRDLLVQN